MSDIIDIIKKKDRLYRALLLTTALLIGAVVYNLFLLKLKIVTGGVSGIGTILNKVFSIDPSITVLVLSLTCSLIGLFFLGKETTVATILASILYSLFIKITSSLGTLIDINTEDIFVTMIIAGILNGISNGLMYKSRYPNGGFPVISQILNEKLGLSVSKTSLFINILIVIAGAYFFGTLNAMYAIIYLYISSIVTDKVLLGISNNKAFYIITSEQEQVERFLIDELQHNVTIFDVKGGYLDKKRKVLLSVIPTSEYYKVTEALKKIDKKAFFVVTDSYEVIGGK